MTEPIEKFDLEARLTTLEREVASIKELISKNDKKFSEGPEKKLSIREFLLTKSVDNDVKRTIAIAYFIEKFENIKSFNTDDLGLYYRQAKHQVPKNLNDKVNMAIKGGFFMDAKEKKNSKKAWELTLSGEQIVENNFHFSK